MAPVARGQRRRVWFGDHEGVIGEVVAFAGNVVVILQNGVRHMTFAGYTEVV